MTHRTTSFTTKEFNALARNADGDIVNLSDAYPFITDLQRERLSADDWSRMEDLDEEMRYMMEDFL